MKKFVILASLVLVTPVFAQQPPAPPTGFINPEVTWDDWLALQGILANQVPPNYHFPIRDWIQRLEDRAQRDKLVGDAAARAQTEAIAKAAADARKAAEEKK